MGDFNVQEAEVLMLEIVDRDIGKVFEESAIAYNLISEGEAKFTNSRGVRLVTHVEPNPGMGWYSEGAILPIGNTSRKVEMKVFFTRFAIAGTLTGDSIDVTSRESLLEALSSRLEEDTTTGIKEFNCQCYMSGDARKAVIDISGGAPVQNGDGTWPITFLAPYGTRQLLNRGSFQVFRPSTGAQVGTGSHVLNSKNNGTRIGTFDSTFPGGSVATNDVLVYTGSYLKGIHGFPYHINDDTGLYQGQSRATYDKLKAPVIDANGAALTVSLLDRLEFQTLYRTGADQDTSDFMILSSPTQAHAYKLLGYNLKRFTGSDKLDLGYRTIEHNGHMWVLDTDCGDADLYMLRRKFWGRYQVRPFGVLKQNGQVLNMIPAFTVSGATVSGSFAEKYVYYLGGKFDIGCKQPHLNTRLKNLDRTNLANGNY